MCQISSFPDCSYGRTIEAVQSNVQPRACIAKPNSPDQKPLFIGSVRIHGIHKESTSPEIGFGDPRRNPALVLLGVKFQNTHRVGYSFPTANDSIPDGKARR